MKVPQELTIGLSSLEKRLQEAAQIKGYRFIIDDPTGAHEKDYNDSSWSYSDKPVLCKRNQGVTWFRFKVVIPQEFEGIPVAGTAVRLQSFFLAPTQVYVDSELRLSERTWVDFKVPEIVLAEEAVPGQVFDIAVRLDFGEYCYWENNFSFSCVYDKAEEAIFEIGSIKEELAYACRFREVRDILPTVFSMLSESLNANDNILDLLSKIRQSRELLKPMEASAKKDTVHLIGHAHIDMNWFWTMDETLDLIRRDFGTMLQLMEEMPEFKFSQSQCATYEIAEKHYPELFRKMVHFVKTGNWDITASAWVEGDLNMASGEAIVRQILYAKKYLRNKFGFNPRIMWCPDTFGHSANMPQILKKSGIDYYFFMRSGLREGGRESNLQTFFRYEADNHLIRWKGIDGSEVLAFNTLYSSAFNTEAVFNISRKLRDQCGLSNSMYVYGTGDHGGGPTRRDLQKAKKLASFPTTPKMIFSTTHDFFDSVVKEGLSNIPVGEGELNFVFDGCYTTHGDIKRYNRLCENRLSDTEAIGAISFINGFIYNSQEVEECWKKTLFNQFHDILDGTSVKATYDYSARIAEEALHTLRNAAIRYIGNITSMIEYKDNRIPLVLFNTTGWTRSECIRTAKPDGSIDNFIAVDPKGNELAVQDEGSELYIMVEDIPPLGYKTLYLEKKQADSDFEKIKENADFYNISTRYYDIEIKKDSGEITMLYDKAADRYLARRDMPGWELCKGVLNTLQIHYETPAPYSSWTISSISSIKNLITGAKSIIKEDGPLVKVINFQHSVGNSTISQDIVIYHNSPRIDFKTHVEWGEYGDFDRVAPMLKASFIPAIKNNHTDCEIPFGAVERLSVDQEIPALRYISIHDDSYVFSLLNDCKYGHRVRGNAMEITLIRSGWLPDPKSDIGSHEFTYSLFTHHISDSAASIKEGYFLNNPVIAYSASDCNVPDDSRVAGGKRCGLPSENSFVRLNSDKGNVVVSAFKPAEYDRAVILRVYEGAGMTSDASVELGFDIDRIQEVSLSEDEVYNDAEAKGRVFSFKIKDFEIKTFKLFLRSDGYDA